MKSKKSAQPVTRKRPADIQTSIREILHDDWNPSGFEDLLPEDVQAHYILPILRILAGTKSEQELLDFLYRTGAGFGGVAPATSTDYDHLRPIARKLLTLKFV
ncbi:MAG: hypothetical protein ACXWKG_03210 [Limisphaerales bacterium]